MADISILDFDPKNIISTSRGPLPPARYNVAIVDSDIKNGARSPGSKILTFKLQFISPSLNGQTINHGLNIVNKSEVAQSIALSELKDYCDAVGYVGKLQDSSKLHGKIVSIDLECGPYVNKKNETVTVSNVVRVLPKMTDGDIGPLSTGSAAPIAPVATPKVKELVGDTSVDNWGPSIPEAVGPDVGDGGYGW